MGTSTVFVHAGANIIILAGLLLLVVSFATNEWVVKKVNRDALSSSVSTSTDPEYYTRRLGLFRECFRTNNDNTDIGFLLNNDNVKSDIVDQKLGCLLVDYLIPEETRRKSSYSNEFMTRIHLMRASVIMLCLSMLFIIIALIIGLTSCWRSSTESKWNSLAKWTGILLFIAAFFNAFGMALWHGAEFKERNRVTDTFRSSKYFDSTWDEDLQNATTRSYSWSYFLCWVAVLLEVVGALMFFLSGWCHQPPPPEKRPVFGEYPSLSSAGYRNRAYDYVENTRGYPMQDPGYVPEDYYYVSNPKAQRYSHYVASHDFGPRGYDSDQGWKWDRY